MSEKIKYKELLEELSILGFSGDRLSKDIQQGLQVGVPNLRIIHPVPYDNELMIYELKLNLNEDSNEYILRGFKATYRSEIKIAHSIFNSIDTQALENAMKNVNWIEYFEASKKQTIPVTMKEVTSPIINDLLRLGTFEKNDALYIQQQLMYKYWPKKDYETYKHPEIEHFGNVYEKSEDFKNENSLIPNAYLAYHMLSGNLDNLYNSLRVLEIGSSNDLLSFLKYRLSLPVHQFELSWTKNTPESCMKAYIPVHWENNVYKPEKCHLQLTVYPSVPHGVYNVVDSFELEKQMDGIDWHNKELFDTGKFKFHPKANEIQEQLYLLGLDSKGADIADILKLKYWIGSPHFEEQIPKSAWMKLEEYEKRKAVLTLDYTSDTMYNLMAGRAVIHPLLNTVEPERGIWLKADTSRKDTEGNIHITTFEGYSTRELERQLLMLPIPSPHFFCFLNALISGESVRSKTTRGSYIQLLVNPSDKVLEIFDKNGQNIPFNFWLDPDWTPSKIKQERRYTTRLEIGKAKSSLKF